MSILSVANKYYLFDALCLVLLNCFDMLLLNKICLNQLQNKDFFPFKAPCWFHTDVVSFDALVDAVFVTPIARRCSSWADTFRV